MTIFIHNTSLVETKEIGENTKIWHWTHICEKSIVGSNCSIGQNCFIANNVKIGNNCKIQNYVSIVDNIIFEDDVFCGPHVSFTNVYNPRSQFPRKNELMKTVLKKGCTVGANVTMICGVNIGSYAFVGAGSVVNRDVKNFSLVVGNPAKQIGWFSRYGIKIDLPIKGSGKYICPHTKDKYILDDETLKLEK